MFRVSKCILIKYFVVFTSLKRLQEYESVPLETVMENKAAEMNGSYEVRYFSTALIDKNIIEALPEHAPG